MYMRRFNFVVLTLLAATAAVASARKKVDDEERGSERMMAEIDAHGSVPKQSMEMQAKEVEAKIGLSREIADALTDIMAILLHGTDESKDNAMEKVIELAVSSAESGKEQARMFRSALVAGGALPAIIDVRSAP